MNLSLDTLYEFIARWGEKKGINYPENVTRQFLKLSEECGELAAGLARSDEEKIKDSLGDIFVVWTILCEQLGCNPREVVNDVYNIISKRKGKTENGVFIKEEDLNKR